MVRRALRQWGIGACRLELLRHGENAVYKVRAAQGAFVARLTTPRFQSPVSVRGELRFIQRCVECGIRAAEPVPNRSGDLLTLVPNLEPDVRQTERIVSLFQFVPGRRVNKRNLTENFARAWGATTARMHAATENFRQLKNARRPVWDEVEFQAEPQSEELNRQDWFRREWEMCAVWLRDLPREEWGLIHADFHPGNFKVRRGEIYVFDFDDSFVGWRMYDLAVIWNVLAEVGDENWTSLRRRAFLEGYRAVRELAGVWEERIAGFQRVRDVWIASWGALRSDVPRVRAWHARFVERLKQKVTGGRAPLI